VLIADGGEEIGSPGLSRALTRIARTVRPDLVLVCDTERSAAGAPTVTVSQRGHVVMDVEVDSGGPAVHSGRLGGAVVDPTVVLAATLARMSDTVTCWPAADPRGPAASASARRLPDAAIIRAARGRATTGEHLHRRITDGPAFSVVQLISSGGRGSIAARAGARIDVRLPPKASVASAVRSLYRSAGQPVGSTRPRCTVIAAGPGHSAVPDPGALAAIDRASMATFGRPAVQLRSGGSLPAAAMLHQAFRVAPVLLGLGTPAGGAHGPDEFLDIPGWLSAVQMLAMIFRSVPAMPHSGPSQMIDRRPDTPDKYVKRCEGALCAPF
jgi:succinyl-diaminopimelate desuccinylase